MNKYRTLETFISEVQQATFNLDMYNRVSYHNKLLNKEVNKLFETIETIKEILEWERIKG